MSSDGASPAVVAERIRVLICDDHALVAKALAVLLAAQPDVEVVGVAGTVAQAREGVATLHPQVVLMDYALPDGDGVAATTAIKDAHPDVQVVMLTAFADEDVLVAAIEAGCSGYLTKDKGADELLAAIRLAAVGQAMVSPDMLARLLPRMRRNHHGLGWDLTSRERQVLDMLADGASKEDIARRLYLSTNTVRNHIQSILTKLHAHSRLEAVGADTREGLVHRG
jgi:DNA-binding NarL/FixJ family response regulator